VLVNAAERRDAEGRHLFTRLTVLQNLQLTRLSNATGGASDNWHRTCWATP
jgi:ABC-type branched-subunit amino acid transport system ATPase component